ncbi:heterodisulfide reductase-related iron-sulfur binding cluster [Pseudomonas aeruginosa]
MLKNEYGALGGDYQVLHHSTFIDELLRAGTLQPGRSKAGGVTYHDPCYLGRYSGGTRRRATCCAHSASRSKCNAPASARAVAAAVAARRSPTSPGKQRIPDMRMADIRETGAELVAVGCPQCTAMLEGVVAPRLESRTSPSW